MCPKMVPAIASLILLSFEKISPITAEAYILSRVFAGWQLGNSRAALVRL